MSVKKAEGMKEVEKQIKNLLEKWDDSLPAIGDADPATGFCRCGCGKMVPGFSVAGFKGAKA